MQAPADTHNNRRRCGYAHCAVKMQAPADTHNNRRRCGYAHCAVKMQAPADTHNYCETSGNISIPNFHKRARKKPHCNEKPDRIRKNILK